MVDPRNNRMEFIKIFNRYVMQKGFVKKGNFWKKEVADYLILLNLQGSQYGGYFYLNIGVSKNLFGDSKIPSSYEWILHTRYETIFGLDNRELQKLFCYDLGAKKIEENIKIITKNLDLCLEIFESLKNINFIERNIEQLRKKFNISYFNREDLFQIIKNDK